MPELSVEIKKSDVLKSLIFLNGRSPSIWFLILFYAALLYWAAYSLWSTDTVLGGATQIFAVLFVAISFVFFIRIAIPGLYVFLQPTRMGVGEYHYTFDESGIRFEANDIVTTLKWIGIKKVYKTKNAIILATKRGFSHIFASRHFDTEKVFEEFHHYFVEQTRQAHNAE